MFKKELQKHVRYNVKKVFDDVEDRYYTLYYATWTGNFKGIISDIYITHDASPIWDQQFEIRIMIEYEKKITGYTESLYKTFFKDIRELDKT